MTSAESVFQITVQPSGRAFSANAGEAILAAAIRSGVGLPYGCKDGACGSCKCKKISGTVQHGAHQSKALSADEEAAGLVLTCCAQPLSDVVLESRQVTDESAYPIKKMPVRVASLEKKSHDVMQVRLQLPAADTFRYHAGQYIEFILRDGARRAYSMANAPHTQAEAPGVELHIRHMPGGKFTDHVFGAMKEKEILRIEGPFGSFHLREEDGQGPLIFLASGTGFAPIKAMLEHMAHTGSQRHAVLYWGARRPADVYMHDWITDYCARHPQVRYVPVISDALPEDGWTGLSGLALDVMLQENPDMRDAQLYACGAPAMVDAAKERAIASHQLDPDNFFADAFTSLKDKADPQA